MAGRRQGFDDTRGTLFFDIARILREKHPRLLLLENVKGLLSHDAGRTFKVIIATLAELGYDCQWQVLNAKDFGVPQNRERVFIVGHLRGTPRPEVFPLAGETAGNNGQNCSTALDANYWKGIDNHGQRTHIALIEPLHAYGGEVRIYEDGYAPTVRARYGTGGDNVPYVQTIPHGHNDGWQKQLPNIRAHRGAVHNEIIMPYLRRLTPIECERLMGFPDGWTAGISDTQRYKCPGNGVVVNVVREIAKRLYSGSSTEGVI